MPQFGKRLTEEASRRWPEAYIDYKSLKHAISEDAKGPGSDSGAIFRNVLEKELVKASTFYMTYESQLLSRASVLERRQPTGGWSVGALRSDALDLRKCAVLNQMAVTKAVKKARRKLCSAGADEAVLDVGALLAPQPFFSSSHLARLLTRLELAEQVGGGAATARHPSDFVCPICLDLLRGPVILNCAHRFCWACLLAHGQHAARYGGAGDAAGLDEGKRPRAPAGQPRQAPSEAQLASAGETRTPVACPVCRQQHFLNLERLAVDDVLEAFVQLLRSRRDGDGGEDGGAVLMQRRTSAAMSIPGGTGRWAGPSPPPPTPPRRRSLAVVEDDTGFDPVLPCFSVARDVTPLRGSILPATAAAAATAEAAAEATAILLPGAPLLPPLDPVHDSRLVICLDLDGTLVTTFSPARAPILPPGSVAYRVGEGSTLNPAGVVVVERPGLGEFLSHCARCGEVVLFTAGLPAYAGPICDALEARYPGAFHHRLYRSATVAGSDYPCVKDLSRLGRNLGRTILVDDTPLAFGMQPDNGIPVLQFRRVGWGDVDDRMLCEALAPLVESLASAHDVRSVLHARFNMRAWFLGQKKARHGLAHSPRKAPLRPPKAAGPRGMQGASRRSAADLSRTVAPPAPLAAATVPILVCDFDHSLMHVDSGTYLCEMLAPELTSLLSVEDPTASWIPATNAVWGEMARRGVSARDALHALRALGRAMPPASAQLLRWAAVRGWTIHILSDCNTLVINEVLTAAGVEQAVDSVVTNPSGFTPAGTLHVEPLQGGGEDGGAGQACPHCPPNLCKGRELDGLAGARRHDRANCTADRSVTTNGTADGAANGDGAADGAADVSAAAAATPRRVVYVGDGVNDLCPALRLGCRDVVLARRGFPLDALLDKHAHEVRAEVHRWGSHIDLLHLVQGLHIKG